MSETYQIERENRYMEKDDILKVGIIGYGKMGMLHGALLCGSRKARITAICDKSFVMRFGFSRVYKGVHTYTDYKKMLQKEDLDIVVITTPPFIHVECAKEAMLKGCDVFMEKPLTTEYEKAKDFFSFCEKRKELVQVGFSNRFVPTIAYAKALVTEGRIGKINNVKAHMYIADVFKKNEGWRYNKAVSGGGVLIDFGIHMVDLLGWYFGEISELTAETKQIYSEQVEDEVYANINFKNGITCELDTSWSKENYRKAYPNMRIYGENGSIDVTEQTIAIYDKNESLVVQLAEPQLYSGAFLDIGGINYAKQMEEFLENIENRSYKSACSAVEACYDQRIVKAMYQSAETGKAVKIED